MLLQKLDAYANCAGAKLCARASQVRSDDYVPCAIDLSPDKISAMMGGQNCHAEIMFKDGVVWLARFRLSSPTSPPQHELEKEELSLARAFRERGRDDLARCVLNGQKFRSHLALVEHHTRIGKPLLAFPWDSNPHSLAVMISA
ncbi:hypothetical protein HC256_009227 [Beauveria bassiana]|uniref:Uncharacterized protein n=1 Tax=Beauveria bassiana (strain ARSEF 2860) TaxID=655819 RepID=J5JZF7_BEAB2|nr:uncharacterized protein BBA_03286 [Beauveria bassiana ARSEF 2860]EJP67506.1 hypothetical protein BBA_03286 [Beauveria bassiana ARSEF 2860]KAH8709302.1 hypothetical protein HC256_009227 [Beauveria bassiana]